VFRNGEGAGSKSMKVLRFEDVIKSGFAKNKRVFIRADLNVPQDNR
jgi:hypothetical protein